MKSEFFLNQPHPENESTACTHYNPNSRPLTPAVDAEATVCCGFWQDGQFWLLLADSHGQISCYHSKTTEGFVAGSAGFVAKGTIRAMSSFCLDSKRFICVHADCLQLLSFSEDKLTLHSELTADYRTVHAFVYNRRVFLVCDGFLRELSEDLNAIIGNSIPVKAASIKINNGRYDKLYEEHRTDPGRLGGNFVQVGDGFVYLCCDMTDRAGVINYDTFACHTEYLDEILSCSYCAEPTSRYLSRRYLLIPNGGMPSVFAGASGELYAAFIGATAYSPVHKHAAVIRLNLHDEGFYYPDSSYTYGTLPAESLRPIDCNAEIRDTFINLMPDGYYYLTGTTARPGGTFWANTNGICLWRSRDLQSFEPLGKVFDYMDIPGCWQIKASGAKNCWAPEICFHGGTYWLTYSTAPGCGLLRSTSGKPEGPYEDYGRVVNRGIDSGFFVDDDGAWYLIWQNGEIAKLSENGNRFEHEPVLLLPVDGQEVGYEGAGIIKVKGKYVLYAAEWHGDKRIDGTYDMMYSVSDSLYGPYSPRRLLVSHAGHGCLFWDNDGNLRYTIFGNDRTAPFRRGVGIGNISVHMSSGELILSAE